VIDFLTTIINHKSMGLIFKIIAFTAGAILTINGISTKAENILAGAEQAANTANIHQLSTAIELYYLDHNTYPDAVGGSELVNILESEHYIKSRPANPSTFAYQPTSDGNNYNLSIK
jgi:hypothetical protein